MIWKSGAKYEGDFENDTLNGFGNYSYSKEDARDYYEGHFKDGMKSGKGKLAFKNGEKYEGNYENDLRSGFGVYTFSKEENRDYYEGHWKVDKMEGKGKIVFRDGTKQEGNFENVIFFQKNDKKTCLERWN